MYVKLREKKGGRIKKEKKEKRKEKKNFPQGVFLELQLSTSLRASLLEF